MQHCAGIYGLGSSVLEGLRGKPCCGGRLQPSRCEVVEHQTDSWAAPPKPFCRCLEESPQWSPAVRTKGSLHIKGQHTSDAQCQERWHIQTFFRDGALGFLGGLGGGESRSQQPGWESTAKEKAPLGEWLLQPFPLLAGVLPLPSPAAGVLALALCLACPQLEGEAGQFF